MCVAVTSTEKYGDLRGGWWFQTKSKTWVPLKRLTRLTQMSSWAASLLIYPGSCEHADGCTDTTTGGHGGDKQGRPNQQLTCICTHAHAWTHTHTHGRNLKGSADILPCSSLGEGLCIWVTWEAKGKTEQKKPRKGKCHPHSMGKNVQTHIHNTHTHTAKLGL